MHLLAVVPFFLKPGYSVPAYHGVCMVWCGVCVTDLQDGAQF